MIGGRDGAGAPGGASPTPEPGAGSAGPGAAQRRYLGGIPGQERRNSGNGTLHLGSSSLYVSKPTELGVTVLGVKYGKVDLDKISSIGIGIGTTTPQNRVAITVHLKDG